MRSGSAMLERLDVMDEYYIEARKAALTFREIALKQDEELSELRGRLKEVHEDRARSEELEKLQAENSSLLSERLHWEGRFKASEEQLEKEKKESEASLSSLQQALDSKTKESEDLRGSLSAAEKETEDLRVRNELLREDLQHAEGMEAELVALKKELEDKRQQLESALLQTKVANIRSERAEASRKMAVSNFLKSESYQRRLAIATMTQALEYYNRALDDAAKHYPGVLAVVRKKKAKAPPPMPDESEFEVTLPEVDLPSSPLPSPRLGSISPSTSPVAPTLALPAEPHSGLPPDAPASS